MKVKCLMLTLVGAVALTATAQEAEPTTTVTTPAKNTAYARNAAGDNWFVTAQAGASAMFFGENDNAKFWKRINFFPSFSFGKWHNPFFGTRLQLNGGVAHTFTGKNGENMIRSRFVGGHFDFLFDVVNYFAPYRDNRVFHLVPWVGVGYNYKFKNEGKDQLHAATINGGLMLMFRIAQRVDIVLEAQAMNTNLNFDKAYKEYNGALGAVTAGLNFRLGDLGWDGITPMDYDMINGLNSELNKLRADNEELSKRPASCPECPEVKPAEKVKALADKSVIFRLNKSVVDRDQYVTVYDVAQFVKENNEPIVVVGHADPSGSADYNMQLSERRAKAVAKLLTEKYGVPSDMITVEWKGASEQVYDRKDWNRVVIMRSK